MSCLNLRFPPARKAWKSFTSKLHTKFLHKLHRSKAIKKPINHLNARTSRLDRHLQRKKTRPLRPPQALRFRHQRRCLFQKSPATVYIDKLFKEPPPLPVAVPEPQSAKKMKLIEDDQAAGRSSAAADDMWESVDLASPQMYWIDERAEEFIARFRAEMEIQEALARRS